MCTSESLPRALHHRALLICNSRASSSRTRRRRSLSLSLSISRRRLINIRIHRIKIPPCWRQSRIDHPIALDNEATGTERPMSRILFLLDTGLAWLISDRERDCYESIMIDGSNDPLNDSRGYNVVALLYFLVGLFARREITERIIKHTMN